MHYVSPFLSFVCDGLKWSRKHIGYATHVQSEINKLNEEMSKLDAVCADVDDKVVTAHIRFQPVKKQVNEWQGGVQAFKAKVAVDIQLPLNCSCSVRCPNCWTRYQLGKRVVIEHKEEVEKLINEGKEYCNGTVVDPTLPSPIETNISSIKDEANKLENLEADINSKVEVTKRESLLLPKHQIEGWIKRVSEYKKNVSALEKDFEEMKKSDCREKSLWVELSHKAEKLLMEIKNVISEGRSFKDVADPFRPVLLVEQAKVPTIGQEEAYARVLDLIRNEKVSTIGIHGMGGVGKTTLLKRINNSFTESDFELIILVPVSKDFTIGEIQQSIMKRCCIDGKNNTPLEMEGKIRAFLKGKKYVLLLDDIWEPLDLNIIGVPIGDNEVRSKILITSRSEGVCDRMQATKVPINCLNESESWELFKTKIGKAIFKTAVGGAILASDIDPRKEELAKQICQYCGGLPLALEVIGLAMREKKTLPEWRAAKNTLENHPPGFEDNEIKLFPLLRLSYDSLKNDTTRECFCYCALFREDWEINSDDLVSCWIGEGLFEDECDNIDKERDKGYTIIQDLIKASLLKEVEDGKDEASAISNKIINECNVVMHDVLRDMALWIKKDEFKISKGRSGFGNTSGKEARLGLRTFGKGDSTEIQKKELVQFGKSAPNLSTLITTSEAVALLGDDTLEAMNKLRVLHVYGWGNCELPPSIGRLKELRYLNLLNATLASTEMLAKLERLRLLIINFPHWTFNLSFEGGFSRLSNLKALFLRQGNYSLGVEKGFGVSITELESLPCLEDLEIFISTTSFLKGLADSPKLAGCVSHLEIGKLENISCFRLIQEVGTMDRLKFLHIEGDSSFTEVVIEEEQRYRRPTLPNFTLLKLWGLNNLIKFRVSMEPKNSLQNLTIISIVGCFNLRFAYMGWPLPTLEVLNVERCLRLEEIFKISGGSGTDFGSLRIIFVKDCPMLERICSDAFCFRSLQILQVTDRTQMMRRGVIQASEQRLRRLPRGVIQASEYLREIRGSQRWWDALTWDSEEEMMSLLPLFKSHGNNGDDLEVGDRLEVCYFVGDHSEKDNISYDLEDG